ncbi:MAG: hypothetical protein M1370_02800 [Bacteroidetes bacterium]|nr:hypothetical protein [Bacteroidota bacterium]
MWVLFRKTENTFAAEAWRELCEDGGVPCRVWWCDPTQYGDLASPCGVFVPNDRLHVAELLAKNI